MGVFVLTGSQQFGLLPNITQSLAGRVGLVQLLPQRVEDLLWRGLYPPLYDRTLAPTQWFANYATTYVERDVRRIVEVQNLSLFQRFLRRRSPDLPPGPWRAVRKPGDWRTYEAAFQPRAGVQPLFLA